MRPRLRIFNGEDDSETCDSPLTIAISFGELVSIIEEASRSRRIWIRDFYDDEIEIPEDLYDVLTAYTQLRPGA